ncbi:lanthionine synthetase C family protein [Archangium violaceum]|uniref:lanthionine synthetase C family protein n=1 Tax=Archangium violaceum TaxID=83451 RepID=UPI00193BB6D3|nr:lanthionine synthetase C family protein [Archangium violaceum]QRK06025.1 lanthionine synthetase C family protein [Archangium violaceum]
MAEWLPLLEGSLRERALEVVDEAASALLAPRAVRGPSLSNGQAGLALLFAELERARPGSGHIVHAERLILEAASALEAHPLPPWLYGGFPGIAWSIERLGTLGVSPLEGLEEIDETLLGLVSQRPWSAEYDLILGLVGIGVYALERLPRPAAAMCLEELVDRLEERSTHTGSGVSWWTPPQHLSSHQRLVYRDGCFNLGAAHGVPAIVALLALIARAGVAGQKARELSSGGARWLLTKAMPDSPGARFPSAVAPERPAEACRSAWCYGDPGVALCLLVAARALSDHELERAVLEIAREAARRPPEHAGVRDAGLCHGATGLGHIYNRLYQASREPLFKEAATAWFARALEMRRPGEGLAGFLSWSLLPGQQEEEIGWIPDGSLLSGTTGIALALQAACHPFTPTWDGMLMAAIPA